MLFIFITIVNILQKSAVGSWNIMIAVLKLMKDEANANKYLMTPFNNSLLISLCQVHEWNICKGS